MSSLFAISCVLSICVKIALKDGAYLLPNQNLMDKCNVISFVVMVLIFASCCESPNIDNLRLCNERVEELSEPPTCSGSPPSIIRAFTASIHAYNINHESSVRFSLYDTTNGSELISETTGILTDFGGPFTSTERCAFYLANTFELPFAGSWPSMMSVEVIINDEQSTYELTQDFSPE